MKSSSTNIDQGKRMQRHNSSNMSSSANSFSSWMQQYGGVDGDEESGLIEPESAFSLFAQFTSIQDNLTSQLSEFSGAVSDGPLSSSFRWRVTYSMYLLIAAVGMALLAFLIGLPTIALRPAKFVVLISLATILATASVVVMQGHVAFLASFQKGDMQRKAAVGGVAVSLLFTLYSAVFIHKYFITIFAGGIQVGAVLFYLSTFIPGGTKGLTILLRTAWLFVKTALKPAIYVSKKFIKVCVRKIMS